MDGGALQITMPEKIRAALDPTRKARYRIIKGGRGKGGSWSIARALVARAYTSRIRVLCCREIQRSIEESVYQLLVDQIDTVGLRAAFDVQKTHIECRVTGSLFAFEGIRALNVLNIKSFEGFDIAWVEEAQAISKKSWDILIPTIRRDGSEIWVNFNPELDSDETYRRFIEQTPPDTILCEVSWRDNPWFPEVLERERKHLEATNKEDYDNIWEGKTRAALPGAIYSEEIRDAIEKKRIRPVPYDPVLRVHTVWDLGWNDRMAIAFVQRLLNQLMVIDYLEDSHKKYDFYVEEIKAKRYNLGRCFLPHDAGHESPLLSLNPEQTLKKLGLDCAPALKLEPVEVGIKRARQTFPRIYFDEVKARPFIDHLKRYRRSIPSTTNEPQGPLNDEHSHAGDVLRYLCACADQMRNDEKDKPLPVPVTGIV